MENDICNIIAKEMYVLLNKKKCQTIFDYSQKWNFHFILNANQKLTNEFVTK